MARVRAPELLGRGGWIGANADFGLSALAGKVVVVHFWRYSSINCVRVLNELRPIEERFSAEAVVLGVHSPKFPREHEHAAVERAVERLGVRHAVLDDPDLATWQQYGVKGWPTLVVIDADGFVVGGVSGEGSGAVVFSAVERAVADGDANGTLVRGTVAGMWGALTLGTGGRPLTYPSRVAVDEDGRRLAVTDGATGRVVVCDLAGRVEHIYPLLTQPQGVRFDGDRLLVCDGGTDRVLAIDRASGEQTVLADGLASPADVAVLADGALLVAEAGRHRLWKVARDGSGKEVVAGTGQENLVDAAGGPALLAQPSGLAPLPGGGAVFVDAESSALRVLTPEGAVVTLVGQGLFDWGASDGGPDSSALQYPLAVAVGPPPPDGGLPSVYVADTFNGLVREWRGTAWEPGAGVLRTLPAAGLEEPGGVAVLPDGRLLVSDANHHRVVTVGTDEIVPEAVAIDESWLGTAVAAPIDVESGEVVRAPFAVDIGGLALDDSAGPPVRVEVSADPPGLLGPGPRVWACEGTSGEVELVATGGGGGVLVVAVEATVTDGGTPIVRRARARHDLTVKSRVSL
ncbi:MAG TPA: redoxin domain-containing protein [Acidimicrobiales bacterium]|nr:redoxin domain-containing protein [Acidimicrobiales bacterium]